MEEFGDLLEIVALILWMAQIGRISSFLVKLNLVKYDCVAGRRNPPRWMEPN